MGVSPGTYALFSIPILPEILSHIVSFFVELKTFTYKKDCSKASFFIWSRGDRTGVRRSWTSWCHTTQWGYLLQKDIMRQMLLISTLVAVASANYLGCYKNNGGDYMVFGFSHLTWMGNEWTGELTPQLWVVGTISAPLIWEYGIRLFVQFGQNILAKKAFYVSKCLLFKVFLLIWYDMGRFWQHKRCPYKRKSEYLYKLWGYWQGNISDNFIGDEFSRKLLPEVKQHLELTLNWHLDKTKKLLHNSLF